MFVINNDKSIYLTRGDIAVISLTISSSDGDDYTVKSGDKIRLRIVEKNHFDRIVLLKDVIVEEDTRYIDIQLTSEDTKIGDIINKPKDYWYEIELNPDTAPQTVIGYDSDGPKIFRLYPEGVDM